MKRISTYALGIPVVATVIAVAQTALAYAGNGL